VQTCADLKRSAHSRHRPRQGVDPTCQCHRNSARCSWRHTDGRTATGDASSAAVGAQTLAAFCPQVPRLAAASLIGRPAQQPLFLSSSRVQRPAPVAQPVRASAAGAATSPGPDDTPFDKCGHDSEETPLRSIICTQGLRIWTPTRHSVQICCRTAPLILFFV